MYIFSVYMSHQFGIGLAGFGVQTERKERGMGLARFGVQTGREEKDKRENRGTS